VQVTIKSDAPEREIAEQAEDDTAFKSTYKGEVDFQRE
jgi:hypothetical protein